MGVGKSKYLMAFVLEQHNVYKKAAKLVFIWDFYFGESFADFFQSNGFN